MGGTAGSSALRRMPDLVTRPGAMAMLSGCDLDWWKEESTSHGLEPMLANLTVASLGLRSGHVLIVHPRDGSPCEELYAQARESARTAARAAGSEAVGFLAQR